MIVDVSRLYEYGLEVKTVIESINLFRMADTADKVIECLKDFMIEENHLLIAVLPSYTSPGSSSVDDFEFTSHLQFLLLKKYDHRLIDSNHYEMVLFQETLNSTKEFIDKLTNDAIRLEKKCSFLSLINWSSMQLDPVRYNGDTLGYSITFSCI